MTSLQARLSTGLILALALLTVLAVAVGGYSLRQMAENFVAARLEHDLEAVLAALSFDASGQPQLAADRIGANFHQPYSGHYYQIETASGELCSRSLWDADLALPPLVADRVTRAFVTGPQEQRLLLVGRAFRVQNQPVAIAVTEDFTPVNAGLRRLLVEFIVIAGVLFGALLLLQRLIVRRGLAPLEQVRRELPRLARGEIPQLSLEAPAEVRPLVAELNRLLELLNQRQRRSRHALGNLAHALKTPLTALTQLAEQPPPPGDATGWWRDLRRQLQHIRALTERELKRARIAGGGAPGQRVLLDREVADLIATLRRIHRDRELPSKSGFRRAAGSPATATICWSCWATCWITPVSGRESRVRLTVGADADKETLCLRIEDDGPGCPPDQLEALRQRGTRIDESRAGHGLGLAIASDIVAQYGGTLRLGRSEDLGGFLAEAMLPCPLVGSA